MISEEMKQAINERRGLSSNELDFLNMQKVLEGKDIPISYPGEYGNHYEESHWLELTEGKRLLIRKWIRFMFSKSKNMNLHRTSYGLKHSCESDVGFYVHNDCMKKAFLLEDYKARTGRINWNFNISGDTTLKKSERFRKIFKEEIEEINNDKR